MKLLSLDTIAQHTLILFSKNQQFKLSRYSNNRCVKTITRFYLPVLSINSVSSTPKIFWSQSREGQKLRTQCRVRERHVYQMVHQRANGSFALLAKDRKVN